jgi:hypothetical protein
MSMATSRLRLAAIPLVTAAPLAIAACGGGATGKITVANARNVAGWVTLAHAARPLDVVGPRADGSLVLAADGRLSILSRAGVQRPFPSVHGAYRSPGGEEPYIALSRGGCIAFDSTGGFGHKLLVTINAGARTTVDAIGCGGTVTTITRTAPRVEGGIAVAPKSFGRFAGDLIAPSETSGQIFAVTPTGKSLLLANSGLPHGNDVGVESEGFVPAGSVDAFVADRLTPGNPHPGDDVVLRLPAAGLTAAGVQPGDLLVATEGGALTDAVSCSATGCRVRFVAQGPSVAHIEGHIAFSRAG